MANHQIVAKIVNIGIRGATLVCRFLFVFFLAKLLNPSEVGLYGLVTASVGYALFFVGLDFYTFTTRELASCSRSEWGGLLKNQALLSGMLYLIVLPIATGVFVFDLLPWTLAPWFILLIVCEHICQECMRLFVAAQEQLAASFVLFLRQGTWALAIVAVMYYAEEYRNLESVFTAWLVACIGAIGFSGWKLKRMCLGGWGSTIDLAWIIRGVKVALPLLVATLALRGVFTVDRYWLQSLAGLEIVGVYVLFVGVANTLMAFLDAGVFSFAYPSMIRAWKEQDLKAFRYKLKEMTVLTVLFSAAFALISILLLPFLLDWLGKAVYLDYYYLYYWLLAAVILNALGMIPHYAIYAQNRDRPIVQSHIGALAVFVPTTALMAMWSPVLAVPAGLCVSQLFILLWKLLSFSKISADRNLLQTAG